MKLPDDIRHAARRIEIAGLSKADRESVLAGLEDKANDHARLLHAERIIHRGGPPAEFVRKIAAESIYQTPALHSPGHKKIEPVNNG